MTLVTVPAVFRFSLPALFAGLVLGLCIPVFMVSQDPEGYAFLDLTMFSIFGGLVLLATMTLVLTFSLLTTAWFGIRYGWGLMWFAVVWLTLGGLLLPLVESTGMVDASETVIKPVSLSVVALVSILSGYISATRAASLVYVFSGVFVASSLVNSAPQFFEAPKSHGAPTDALEVSMERNIFVISFDGIPANVAKAVLESEPEVAASFSDFVFFANAISPAPATQASIRSELFGHKNFRVFGENDTAVDTSLDLDNLPVNLLSDAYAYGAYSRYAHSTKSVPRGAFSGEGFSDQVSEHRYWFELMFARTLTYHGSKILGFLHVGRLAERAAIGGREAGGISGKVRLYQGPDWKASILLDHDEYVGFVNNLAVTKTGISLRQMHFAHTHFPVDFDRDCRFRGGEEDWHVSAISQEALYDQALCEFSQFDLLLKRLKDLGIYDRSMIVLKSDHGEPAYYFDSYPHNLLINGHSSWGYNRYVPLLMIKDAEARRDSIKVDSSLVSLADLARTVCLASELGIEHCGKFAGVDLSHEFDVRSSPDMYIDVVTGPNSRHSFETHKTIHITRGEAAFLELLSGHAEVELSQPATTIEAENDKPQFLAQRMDDLESIRDALKEYYTRNQKFPRSEGWDGVASNWGRSSDEWIVGLVPDYMAALPRDPRHTHDGSENYLYRSNGKDFKLLAHGVRSDCSWVQANKPELIDPVRDCWAYGFWTERAKSW
jgi:hypothetical protein